VKNPIRIIAIICIIVVSIFFIHGFTSKEVSFFQEKIKVALRAAGNKLLLKNNDHASLVLPIRKIDDQTFELSFQKEIVIHPKSLVTIINTELKKTGISENYITELVHCNTQQVSYSYQILGAIHENEISCVDRDLPKSCYTIKLIVLKEETPLVYSAINNPYTLSLLILGVILLSITTVINKKPEGVSQEIIRNHITLGTIKFYPDRQKLYYDQQEVSLTTKESELLAIFARQPNEIIKREVLIKQVWEDNGVIVGRSLDMFISKLRKKLGSHTEVKITNVHGVGYKLEIPETY